VKPIILLGCDGPLAGFTKAYLNALWLETGARIDEEEVDLWAIHECAFFKRIAAERGLEDHHRLRKIVDAHVVMAGFCDGIAPQPGAQDAVRRLSELGEVFVVTSPWDSSPTWMFERLHWVARHFPTIGRRRVIQTAQKHLIRGDVFVDDKLEHVETWSAAWPGSKAILFDMHHNRRDSAKEWRGGWGHAIDAAAALTGSAASPKENG